MSPGKLALFHRTLGNDHRFKRAKKERASTHHTGDSHGPTAFSLVSSRHGDSSLRSVVEDASEHWACPCTYSCQTTPVAEIKKKKSTDIHILYACQCFWRHCIWDILTPRTANWTSMVNIPHTKFLSFNTSTSSTRESGTTHTISQKSSEIYMYRNVCNVEERPRHHKWCCTLCVFMLTCMLRAL